KCVTLVVQNNPELRTAIQNLKSAQDITNQSISYFLPHISSQVGLKKENTANTYTVGLTGTQSIFSGLQDWSKKNQAELNQKIAEISLLKTKSKLSFELKSVFKGLETAQKLEALAEQIIIVRKDNLKLIELSYEGGRENKGSLLLAKAYTEEAKLEEISAKNAIQINKISLAKILGSNDNESIQIQGTIHAKPPSTIKVDDLKESVLHHPEYEEALLKLRLAEEGIREAWSAFLPNLNLTANYGNKGESWFPNKSTWSVELGLTLPLFQGGKDYYHLQSAKNQFFAIEYQLEITKRELYLKLKESFAQYTEAFQKLKVDQTFLEAAKVRAKIAKNKYGNGLLSFEDWDKIENDLIKREKGLIESANDVVIKEAAWEQAQGKGIL
ncbi:MAG: TolC family protein, partial [Deltaproteobacteria bacterium]|nr:TolC family protein [Deltaproteobacteria bacterium]